MSSLTSKLNLKLFGRGLGGDVQEDEPADISGINDNMKLIDAFIGMAVLCLSTARPANPFSGMGIYETDTRRGYLFTGLAFELIFDANLTSGLQGTAAQRNAYWGLPTNGTTTAEIQARSALANKGARWFNADVGYEERYFAKVGDTGALDANVALTPGWFPSGSGIVPRAGVMRNGAAMNIGAGHTVFTTNTTGFQEDNSKPLVASYGKIDGTAPGLRLIPGIEGVWLVRAQCTGNFGGFNLVVKLNDVSAGYSGAKIKQSAGTASGLATGGISFEVPLALAATDFLILDIHSGVSGTVDSNPEGLLFSIEWLRPRTK